MQAGPSDFYRFTLKCGEVTKHVRVGIHSKIGDLDDAFNRFPHRYFFDNLELDRNEYVSTYRGVDFDGGLTVTAIPAEVELCRLRDLREQRVPCRARRRVAVGRGNTHRNKSEPSGEPCLHRAYTEIEPLPVLV